MLYETLTTPSRPTSPLPATLPSTTAEVSLSFPSSSSNKNHLSLAPHLTHFALAAQEPIPSLSHFTTYTSAALAAIELPFGNFLPCEEDGSGWAEEEKKDLQRSLSGRTVKGIAIEKQKVTVVSFKKDGDDEIEEKREAKKWW
jgi:hypothetical protein